MVWVILVTVVPIALGALVIRLMIHGEANTERHGHSWRTPANRRTDKLNRMQARVDRYARRNGFSR